VNSRARSRLDVRDSILQVEVNVGDDQYIDLEKEAAGMMARE
jgi:hypothetical protein